MFLIVSLHIIMVLQCKYEHLFVLIVQPRSSSRKLCSAWEEMGRGGKGGVLWRSEQIMYLRGSFGIWTGKSIKKKLLFLNETPLLNDSSSRVYITPSIQFSPWMW